MRQNLRSAKLLLAALLTFTLCPAHADDATPDAAASAETKAKAEVLKTQILQALNLDAATSVVYQDEQGRAIDDMTFFTQLAQGRSLNANKTKENGKQTATLKLLTKEEQAESKKPLSYKVKPGEAFPAFKLPRLAGGDADSAQFAGRPALINFYFSECAPCRKEVPDLNALAASHPETRFLAVTFDPADETRKFVSETRFAWPAAPDAVPFINQIGIKMYPSFALIDADGKLVTIQTGAEIENSDGNVTKWLERLHPAAKAE